MRKGGRSMGQLNGWAFPVEVDEATGRVKLVEDDDCVRQDIRLIVQTDRGERKMRPNFGAGLNRFLFRNVDLVLVNRMSEALAQSIQLWEEHVIGVNAGVSQVPENNTQVRVNIEYVTDLEPGRIQRIEERTRLNEPGG